MHTRINSETLSVCKVARHVQAKVVALGQKGSNKFIHVILEPVSAPWLADWRDRGIGMSILRYGCQLILLAFMAQPYQTT